MIPKLKAYLKKETREMFLAFISLIMICLMFMAYLKYLGIPMSRAHNLYNKAVLALEEGEKEKAITYLEDSLTAWNDDKIRSELEALKADQE